MLYPQPTIEPSGLNVIRAGSNPPVPMQLGINAQLNDVILQRQETKIKEVCFNDLFQSLAEHRNMTATEVVGRREEALTQLSPPITSLQKEMFDPLLNRAFALIARSNRVPPAPQKFDYDVKYRGRLAMAMSKTHSDATMAHLAEFAPYFQFQPSLIDNWDWDKVVRNVGLDSGVPAELLMDDEAKAQTRQQRSQQEQAMVQAETMEKGSKALLNVAKSEAIV